MFSRNAFWKSFILVLSILLIGNSISPAQSVGAPFIPHEGRLLFIGQQVDSIDGYIQNLGPVFSGLMTYTSIQEMDGLTAPADHGGGVMNAQSYINTYPHLPIQIGLYMVGALEGVLAGQYDNNILLLSRWLKQIDCPVYLRIGYEFDLPANNYDPNKYKLAYRYIVDHLRAQGVHNVAYVWHTSALESGQGNYMDWYPGDDYVDWFGVSIFNSLQFGVARGFFDLARQHHKQLMIAESTPAGEVSTRSKQEWFRHYFEFIKDQDVKIVCYINCNWNSYPLFANIGWNDQRIEEDPDIKQMWLDQTKDHFLLYSLSLCDKLVNE